jgi:hypothetical protein
MQLYKILKFLGFEPMENVLNCDFSILTCCNFWQNGGHIPIYVKICKKRDFILMFQHISNYFMFWDSNPHLEVDLHFSCILIFSLIWLNLIHIKNITNALYFNLQSITELTALFVKVSRKNHPKDLLDCFLHSNVA